VVNKEDQLGPTLSVN